jgi:hypothetical protein
MIRAEAHFWIESTSRKLLFLLLLFLLKPDPRILAQDANHVPAPTVTFTLDFPQSIPDHYVLKVGSDGHASYNSTGKLTPDGDAPEPFHLDFVMSQGNCGRIFELAQRAKYFDGKVDSGKHNLANTGAKTLTYSDAQRSTHATYNYSSVQAVQELTGLFQNISMTLEFGRRLEYLYRYQKLGLDEELKHMDEMQRSKSLEEVQAISPILKKISADQSVINVVRARALRLAEQAQASR